MGVREGVTSVLIVPVEVLVGVEDSLGLGVMVGLGVMGEMMVGVSVNVLVAVTVRLNANSQGATPDNPRLYASNILNNLVPTSSSLSDT
jgi:hypothetical protein